MDQILVIILVVLDSDIAMYLFVEKRMREGISYLAKIHSKANDKCMKSYNDNKPTIYIIYLHANMYNVGK